MQLELESLSKIKHYFDLIDGNRVSDWVSEMKRQIAVEMYDKGARNKHIMKLLHVHNSTASYYRTMDPIPYAEEIVSERLMEWIEFCAYPIPKYENIDGKIVMNGYKLVDHTLAATDPKTRQQARDLRKKKSKFEQMLDDILE
jgi:hypothetical protein